MADIKQSKPTKSDLMKERIVDLTFDQLQELRVPLGFAGLPYPMVTVKEDDKGALQRQVGVIQGGTPMLVYTDQSPERVNGLLFRQMPTPGMMLILRDLLAKIGPESKNRIMTVLGDAAFGKSHLFKLVGSIVHPQGPISVDCGGMNMHELFFRTVIDYGKGIKEQFEKRIEQGKVTQASLDTLKEEFPNSVIQKDGKTLIDWDAIGRRRAAPTGYAGKITAEESYGDAAIRAERVLSAIFAKEGLSTQSNSFGIKNVPGEIIESIQTGRPLFLDEITKCKPGTLDSFQTFLQFAKGEIDTITLRNPLAENGGDTGDSPKQITINRSDLKVGWHITTAGNESSDGITTHDLSVSMMTRLDPAYVGAATKADWAHRISQIYTGLPLTTLYSLFQTTAQQKPDEFASWLTDLRKLGLSAEEQMAIPPHETALLVNFQKTVNAIEQIAEYYSTRQQLSNPESELANTPAFQALAEEISADGKKIGVSFRRVISDFHRAIEPSPEVRPAADAAVLLDLKKAFDGLNTANLSMSAPAWHALGEHLSRVVVEDISNSTLGMPKTSAALLTVCKQCGIVPPGHKEAKAGAGVKPISELLKYDGLAEFGGTKELTAVRDVVMGSLRSMNPNLKVADDKVIPLLNLGMAMKSLEAKAGEAHRFVIPNDDLDTATKMPLLGVEALPTYYISEEEELELVDYRAVVAALAMPGYAEKNRANIWPVEVLKYLTSEKPTTPEQLEPYKTLMGQSSNGFNLGFLAVADSGKRECYLSLVEDKETGKTLILGPSEISPQLQADLAKNNIKYAVKSDPATLDLINDFLAEGALDRGTRKKMKTDEVEKIAIDLSKAFSTVCHYTDADAPRGVALAVGSTIGKAMVQPSAVPILYTAIFKNRKGPKATTA